MSNIVFIDTEVDVKSKNILDFGGTTENDLRVHSNSVSDLINFISQKEYICGHNIIKHDLPFIERAINRTISDIKTIDTLYLSPLLFPTKPYHALLKDDKLQTEELNNPLNDAIKARDLFYDEISAFQETNNELKQIYFALLGDKKEFQWFFDFNNYSIPDINIVNLIKLRFSDKICQDVNLHKLVLETPVELAYCLAIINCESRYSITPPWVIKNYPEIERVMYLLRNNPCLQGCTYCNKSLDAKIGLKKFFGFDSYRTYGGKTLQEDAVKAAINHKSILAVFPTGGGKSVTFQVPALMSGEK
jgi:ATP-dependent DNA helicase RecQ